MNFLSSTIILLTFLTVTSSSYAQTEYENNSSVNMQSSSSKDDPNFDFYIGLEYGKRLQGGINSSYPDGSEYTDPYGYSSEYHDAAYGIEWGAIVNRRHRVATLIQYKEASLEDWDPESHTDTIDSMNFIVKYDYMLPLTSSFYLTAGGKLGYESIVGSDLSDREESDFSGPTYGVQTGLYYMFDNWSLSTELSYDIHTGELETEYGSTVSYDNEVIWVTSLDYHY
ncbi:hypothetical protein J4N42_15420 [Vibrio sp. SCSIO 43135]|uniref:hypothetical protein n=1 Tax=Vibrio sp. SCSIO 43135 TaxID=2819096 RepID=UPI002075E661|nr:hypothetical protein [Vibrio sp. SCSIO 43135]USD43565.1 hypothetical protein J4N42_15420 [Vibrio sp. SCSIO 43135]